MQGLQRLIKNFLSFCKSCPLLLVGRIHLPKVFLNGNGAPTGTFRSFWLSTVTMLLQLNPMALNVPISGITRVNPTYGVSDIVAFPTHPSLPSSSLTLSHGPLSSITARLVPPLISIKGLKLIPGPSRRLAVGHFTNTIRGSGFGDITGGFACGRNRFSLSLMRSRK